MIVVVDMGVGNIGSIVNMLKKVGAQAVVSSDPAVIEGADKLILPGVGAFDNGMRNLTERRLVPVLTRKVREERTPILGVCLGMQLFTERSAEGRLPGLGWLAADTVRFSFEADQGRLKVPHMGWNTLRVCRPHPLFADLDDEPRFYFVHSYHLVCRDPGTVLAETSHGYAFPAAVGDGNIVGVQFHPEKSHRFGMRLLANFAERPS
jgi:glutamine amidotransferase